MLRALEVRGLALPPGNVFPYPLLWRHMLAFWPIYVIGSITLLFTCAVEILQPKIVQWTLDLLSNGPIPFWLKQHGKVRGFEILVCLFAVVLIVQWFNRRYWRLTLGQETHHVASDLKSAVWERTRFFRHERLLTSFTKGVLMNIATGDVSNARMLFGWTLVGILDVIGLVSLGLIMMWSISWELTIWIAGILTVLPLLTYRTAERGLIEHNDAQDQLSELNELTNQAVATVKLQRLAQSERSWLKRLVNAAETYRLSRLREAHTFLNLILLMGLPPLLGYGVLFWLGMEQIQRGVLSIGEFIALQSYMVLLQHPLTELGYIIAEWQRSIGSLQRIAEVLREPMDNSLYEPETPVTAVSPIQLGCPMLQIDSLSFRYPLAETEILSQLSLSLKHGERLGVYGAVGSGKSTLLQIVAGLERRYQGSVRLLEHEVRCYPTNLLRSFVSIVDQRPFLFADSVRRNVMLGREAYRDDELWHYLEIAGLAEDIARFKDGVETQLGEWGINLSGGQQQRLTLARALAAQPRLLLLDDCLSAVDTVTEEKILKALDKHLAETTLIWVAHRKSTLRYCNSVMELRR